MKNSLIIFICLLGLSSLYGQTNVMEKDEGAWNTLSMVTFKLEFDETFGIDVEKPILNPIVKSLDGKEIEVEGYIIPLTGKVEQSHFKSRTAEYPGTEPVPDECASGPVLHSDAVAGTSCRD